MSTFMKTSPLSSTTYGAYGAANVNPYASYFGAQHNSNVSSPYSPTSQGQGATGGYYSAPSPQSNSFMSPTSSLTFNPHSFGAATSPFANSGQPTGTGGGQHFVPLPAQTRIIGGLNHTAGVASSSSFHQSPPRYLSGYNQHSSPGRTEEFLAEPMHFSPIHVSPNQHGQGHTIGIHNSSPPNAILLPSYLLGMDQQNYHHSSYHQSGGPSPTSSGGINQSASSGVIGPSTFMNPPGAGYRNYRKVLFFEPSGYTDAESDGAAGDSLNTASNKLKGPPRHGFGLSESSTTKDFLESPWMKDSYNVSPVTAGGSQSQKPPSTSTTAASTWVTVFGFPAGASSFILKNFSTFGKIMEVKATHGSNWLHIRYNNKIEARLALSKNGKVLGGSIMVGVVNSDSKVVQDAQSAGVENTDQNSSQCATSPSTSSLQERHVDSDIKARLRPLATGSLPQQPMTSKANPRSLSQMPSLAREAIEVERNTSGSGLLPSASNGMFTKAMEFMFGW